VVHCQSMASVRDLRKPSGADAHSVLERPSINARAGWLFPVVKAVSRAPRGRSKAERLDDANTNRTIGSDGLQSAVKSGCDQWRAIGPRADSE
jgi:hypothetical protein